ncbi:MAG: hypothetical protein WCW16_05185 [Candidatus Magasanikbacteria bacterium]
MNESEILRHGAEVSGFSVPVQEDRAKTELGKREFVPGSLYINTVTNSADRVKKELVVSPSTPDGAWQGITSTKPGAVIDGERRFQYGLGGGASVPYFESGEPLPQSLRPATDADLAEILSAKIAYSSVYPGGQQIPAEVLAGLQVSEKERFIDMAERVHPGLLRQGVVHEDNEPPILKEDN